MDAGEMFVKTGRDPFEGPHGRGRIEKVDAHQVHLAGAEGVGAAKNLADIEGRFEAVQDNNETVGARRRQSVGIFLPPETLARGDALLLKFAAKLS